MRERQTVSVHSGCDNRPTPLIADVYDICGWACANLRFRSNGVVCAMHADDLTCDGNGKTSLGGIPVQFLRLGVRSRRLVLSLYRALVERFVVMKSSGSACYHADDLGPAAGVSNLNCIVRTPRRAFGGTFRNVVSRFVAAANSTSVEDTEDGSRFYPVTPFREAAASGALFDKPCGGDTWCAMKGAWLNDMTQRSPFAAGGSWNDGTPGFRPLLKDVVCAFAAADLAGFVSGTAAFTAWAECRYFGIAARLHCRNEPFGRFAKYYCNDAPADECKTRKLFCVCKLFDPSKPGRFYLPLLALALRIASVMNVQTVRRRVKFGKIKHTRITATRTVCFGFKCGKKSQPFVKQEALNFSKETVECDGIRICAKISSHAGGIETPKIEFWAYPNLNYDTIVLTPESDGIVLYEHGEYCKDVNPYDVKAENAFAGITAIWPCWCDLESCPEDFLRTTIAEYPAKWAKNEGDLHTATVTGFLKTTPAGMGHKIIRKVFGQPRDNYILALISDTFRCQIIPNVNLTFCGRLPINSMADAIPSLGESLNCVHCFICALQNQMDHKYHSILGHPWKYVEVYDPNLEMIVEKPYYRVEGNDCVWLPVDIYNGPDDSAIGLSPKPGMWYLAEVDPIPQGAGMAFDYGVPGSGASVGPYSVTFGGTFFETYAFHNRAAVQ